MFVFDTNIISELIRPQPNENVLRWVAQTSLHTTYITVITKAELYYGVLLQPDGKRREHLSNAIDVLLKFGFEGRILNFDSISSEHFAEIASNRRYIGRPISHADAQIATICKQHQMTLVTRNVSDFSDCGIDLINPFHI